LGIRGGDHVSSTLVLLIVFTSGLSKPSGAKSKRKVRSLTHLNQRENMRNEKILPPSNVRTFTSLLVLVPAPLFKITYKDITTFSSHVFSRASGIFTA
jgi:hypothetical protein